MKLTCGDLRLYTEIFIFVFVIFVCYHYFNIHTFSYSKLSTVFLLKCFCGRSIVGSLALVRPYLALLPLILPTLLSSIFLHACWSHMRGILCEIHTSCMESLFPIVYTKLPLISVFCNFFAVTTTVLGLIYKDNNNNSNSRVMSLARKR